MKVSVVMPLYNAASYLADSLGSLQSQTLENFEAIVVDDGSTDGSCEVFAKLVGNDARFRLIRQKNSGAGAARNLGMSLSSGEALIFLDSDDVFVPELLSNAVTRLNETGSDICLFGAATFSGTNMGELAHPRYLSKYFRHDERFAPLDARDHLFQITNPAPWTKLFRTEFVRSTGLTFQRFNSLEAG